MEVTTDPDHKFDLALQMGELETAQEIVRLAPENEAEIKWKSLGDRALAVWRFELAREAFEKAGDLNALMLLLLSIGDRDGLSDLANKAGTFILMLICSASLVLMKGYQRKRGKTILRLHRFSKLET